MAASVSSSVSTAVAGGGQLVDAGHELGPLPLELGHGGGEPLGALHHLELDVLELGLAPGQRVDLVLQGLHVLGGPLTGHQPALVAGRAVADQLHVGVGLGDLALHVGLGGAGPHEVVVEHGEAAGDLVELALFGQGGGAVGDLVQAGVDGLQVQQPPLAARVGFQDVPPGTRVWRAPTRKSQGSVRNEEMWGSNLVARSPSSCHRRSRALSSHSHSLAQ